MRSIRMAADALGCMRGKLGAWVPGRHRIGSPCIHSIRRAAAHWGTCVALAQVSAHVTAAEVKFLDIYSLTY
jgi:hypothetical protein